MPFALQSFFVGVDELLLADHAVDGLQLLTLFELEPKVRFFLPLRAMHPGRMLFVKHWIAGFAKDIGGKFTGDAVFRSSITSH